MRLTGKFKTAFPEANRRPPSRNRTRKTGGEKARDARRAGSEGIAQENVGGPHRRLRFHPGSVAVQEAMNPFGGQRMVMPANGNLAFAQRRHRATRRRQQPHRRAQPRLAGAAFTVVKKMQADGRGALPQQDQGARTSLADAQRKLTNCKGTRRRGRSSSSRRAAGGDREFPQKGGRGENGSRTSARNCAPTSTRSKTASNGRTSPACRRWWLSPECAWRSGNGNNPPQDEPQTVAYPRGPRRRRRVLGMAGVPRADRRVGKSLAGRISSHSSRTRWRRWTSPARAAR